MRFAGVLVQRSAQPVASSQPSAAARSNARRRRRPPRLLWDEIDRATTHAPEPLPTAARSRAEKRLGTDLGAVRLHRGTQAAQAADSLDAKAFTLGNDVVFARDEYHPDTPKGQRLLAHELTHVVQQRQQPPRVQRKGVEESAEDESNEGVGFDAIVGSENSLICFALCYLGLPPGIWRKAVSLFLGAVSEEYSTQSGKASSDAAYRRAQTAFKSLSALNMAKNVLGFAMTGKVAFVNVAMRSAKARELRRALLRYLLTHVAPRASLSVGLQILRKVTLAVEIAWASSCALGCGAAAAGRKVSEFITEAVEGVAGVIEALSEIGNAVGEGVSQLITAPLLALRAELNPDNHVLSADLPSRLRADMGVLLYFLWSKLDHNNWDELIAASQRELRTFRIPSALLRDIAQGLQRYASGKSGLTIEISASLLSGLSPSGLVGFLRMLTALKFAEDPMAIARRDAGAR